MLLNINVTAKRADRKPTCAARASFQREFLFKIFTENLLLLSKKYKNLSKISYTLPYYTIILIFTYKYQIYYHNITHIYF